MHQDKLKILARNGAVLVSGQLSLRSAAGHVPLLPVAGADDLIAVEMDHPKLGRSGFQIMRGCVRADDGLYAAGPPAMTVEFGAGMPSLGKLAKGLLYCGRSHSMLVRASDTEPGTWLMTAYFRIGEGEDFRHVYCHLEEVALEVKATEAGVEITMQGPVLPFALETNGPLLSDVWFDCAVVLPPAFCNFANVGPSYSNYQNESEWRAGSGLSAIPLSPASLGPGIVDWGQTYESRQIKGPFVAAYLREDNMLIKPARAILHNALGQCRADTADGEPELEIGIGRSMIAAMLAKKDHATASFSGGIGHLNGLTGRAVHECGGSYPQELVQLTLTLDRSPQGLAISGVGKLAPLHPAASPRRSLGPDLRFSFTLERTWLLARGIELPRFWDDWKAQLPAKGVW